MIDIDQYHFDVGWSEEDQQYVGTCREFPSLSWLDDTEPGAMSGIHELVREVAQNMLEHGERTPSPGQHHWGMP